MDNILAWFLFGGCLSSYWIFGMIFVREPCQNDMENKIKKIPKSVAFYKKGYILSNGGQLSPLKNGGRKMLDLYNFQFAEEWETAELKFNDVVPGKFFKDLKKAVTFAKEGAVKTRLCVVYNNGIIMSTDGTTIYRNHVGYNFGGQIALTPKAVTGFAKIYGKEKEVLMAFKNGYVFFKSGDVLSKAMLVDTSNYPIEVIVSLFVEGRGTKKRVKWQGQQVYDVVTAIKMEQDLMQEKVKKSQKNYCATFFMGTGKVKYYRSEASYDEKEKVVKSEGGESATEEKISLASDKLKKCLMVLKSSPKVTVCFRDNSKPIAIFGEKTKEEFILMPMRHSK